MKGINRTKLFVESVYAPYRTSVSAPKKEDMQKLLPTSWPPRWQEVDRYAKDALVTVSLAHINPYPQHELGVRVIKQGFGIAGPMASLKPEKFDFVAHLSITGYGDKQTAREFFESYRTIPAQGLSAPTPGAAIDIPLGDLIRAFAPKEMVTELQSALEKAKGDFAKSGVPKIEKGEHVGEEAILAVGEDGKKGCNAVLINNFVITGTLLLLPGDLEPGSTRTHTPICKCRSISGCTTLKAAGYMHREEAEGILRAIFARIKATKITIAPELERLQGLLTKVSRIKEGLRSATGQELEKAAEEIYQHGKDGIDSLFELGIDDFENLKRIYDAYEILQSQVRANQSMREKPPASLKGYKYLGRTIVKDGAFWAEHIQVQKGRSDMTELVGTTVTKNGKMQEDTVLQDHYQRL